jgi:hypothetical protein
MVWSGHLTPKYGAKKSGWNLQNNQIVQIGFFINITQFGDDFAKKRQFF